MKRTHLNRILSLALAALMLASVLSVTACGDSDAGQSTETTAAPSAGETTAFLISYTTTQTGSGRMIFTLWAAIEFC